MSATTEFGALDDDSDEVTRFAILRRARCRGLITPPPRHRRPERLMRTLLRLLRDCLTQMLHVIELFCHVMAPLRLSSFERSALIARAVAT